MRYYILQKHIGSARAREISGQLIDVVDIVPVDKAMLKEAIGSPIADFEDAIVEAAAYRASSDYIVTSNLKDFVASRIPVVTPRQALVLL